MDSLFTIHLNHLCSNLVYDQKTLRNQEEQFSLKPRINKFNFKRTDLVLDRIKQKPEMSAGMRIQGTHVFILVHSYRATSSLTLP